MRVCHVQALLLILSVSASLTAMGRSGYDALESSSLFFGIDSSNPNSSGRSVFSHRHNHPAAVVSVLWFLASSAQFCPSDQEVVTEPLKYDNFLVGVDRFPGFLIKQRGGRTRRDIELSGDMDKFVDEILVQNNDQNRHRHQEKVVESEVVGDLDKVDELLAKRETTTTRKREVAEALHGLIPPFIEDGSWKRWVLTLIVISADDDNSEDMDTLEHCYGFDGTVGAPGTGQLTVQLIQLSLSLSQRRGTHPGKTDISPQRAQMSMATYNVDPQYLIEHAGRLARNIEKITVDEFLNTMTTIRWPSMTLDPGEEREGGRAKVMCGDMIPCCQLNSDTGVSSGQESVYGQVLQWPMDR